MPSMLLKRQFQKRYPGPFTYLEGRDGVDDTFDVLCLTSGQHLASTYYWKNRETALMHAATVSFALNAYLFDDDTALSLDEIGLLQQFLCQYPGPYRSQREFCDYRGPGYSTVSSPTGEHLISVYGGYFHRQTRSIARTITKALNGLPSHCPIVPLSEHIADDGCPLCGGQRWPLGQLGQLTHHRCRNCGLESHDQTLTV